MTDENFELAIVAGLRRRQPELDIQTAVEDGILGLPDPQVLAYAAAHDRILVSHDKRTMPDHFAIFLASGQQCPGVMLISPKLTIGESIDALLIWEASQHTEWRDLVTRLPL